jgi:signal peptidase I
MYAPPPPPPPPPETRKQKVMRRVGLVGASAFLLIPFFILLAVFLLIVFVGKPYIVHGESMLPTIHNDDRVFVVPYRGGTTPSRGDVVVLKNVPGTTEMLIKRIVAIGGDRVKIENGDVIVNDKYRHKSTVRYVSEPYTQLVPDNYVFVMGDNEAHSFDSRTFGAIPEDRVVGKALVIFWPPSDLKKL